MPQKDNNSVWVEGVEPAPKKAPRKTAPKVSPFEQEFPPMKKMPPVYKVNQKRMSKA